MTDYEKYQLRCMIDRGYSLQDLMRDLTEFQSGGPEDGGRPSLTISELFDEWATGSGIWASEEEWHERRNRHNQQCLTIDEGTVTCYDGYKGDVSIPEGITAIDEYAFAGCTGMTSVSIPDSVTRIGPWAFADCSDLIHMTLPEGITDIPRYAFRDCTGLEDMTIPEGVSKIGYAAFYGCTGLTGISIPETVTEIGDDAFAGCPGLTVHAPAGSYAERYAKETGIAFEAT